MSRSLCCLATLCASSFLIVGQVHAGPIELFDGAQIQPGDPNTSLIQYQWGGSGFIVSHDGDKSFGLVCTSSVSTDLRSDKLLSYLSGSGNIYIGGFSGLYRGDQNGCGFTPVDALKNRFVAAIAGDPLDLKRTYVTTANGGDTAMNGIYTNDGMSDTWTALGPLEPSWIQSLHVVKTSTGKRFWETKVFPDPVDPMTMMPSSVVHYVARFSDDEGKTWTEHELSPITQFGMADPSASFRLIAVDPKNPDQIYGVVMRNSLPDDLLYSPMRGETGTWTKIAEVTELGGIAFTPDGKLYFSDSDQTTKQVAVIETPKAAPRTITDQYVVGCLRWDDAQNRMLACKQWQFGTLDLEKGTFSALYDMRCGQRFSSCPGIADTCETQMLNGWCGTSHYPSAPLCADYMVPDAAQFIHDYLDFDCVDGLTVPRPMTAGSGGDTAAVSGSGGGVAATAGAGGVSSAAGTGAAGASGAASSTSPVSSAGSVATGTAGTSTTVTAPPPAKKSGGCSVAKVGEQGSSHGSGWGLGFALFGLASLVHSERRRRSRA